MGPMVELIAQMVEYNEILILLNLDFGEAVQLMSRKKKKYIYIIAGQIIDAGGREQGEFYS